MKRFYKIEDNYATIELSSNIYPIISIQKSISYFLEIAYIKLEEQDNKIIIKIKLKNNNNNLEQIIGEFYDELLRESLRYNIARETKNLRELIVGRALYTTCIETNNEKDTTKIEYQDNEQNSLNISEEEDYPLDEIALNWFEEHDDIK